MRGKKLTAFKNTKKTLLLLDAHTTTGDRPCERAGPGSRGALWRARGGRGQRGRRRGWSDLDEAQGAGGSDAFDELEPRQGRDSSPCCELRPRFCERRRGAASAGTASSCSCSSSSADGQWRARAELLHLGALLRRLAAEAGLRMFLVWFFHSLSELLQVLSLSLSLRLRI